MHLKNPCVLASLPTEQAGLPTGKVGLCELVLISMTYLLINLLAFSPYTFFSTVSLNPNPCSGQ